MTVLRKAECLYRTVLGQFSSGLLRITKTPQQCREEGVRTPQEANLCLDSSACSSGTVASHAWHSLPLLTPDTHTAALHSRTAHMGVSLAETAWHGLFLGITNIRNTETYQDNKPTGTSSSLPAIFFWPYISSSYLWKVFWLPCFWCLFAAMGAEDIEYNLSDSCFYIKRPVSVAINDSCFNIISLSFLKADLSVS